ncbi:30S ribosomal protein S20 [Dehalobacterium formicoaceticum]|uniref:Small ribosomal subunit protein bS20 n=1 Tax=Dehalobacterium formicoaceticum TaxID=51515 RepID=A0ABT1Y254_9FIRM|nr:30S ribosomal protein S20 [Dehalobacterium formicoaceticum]MCR6544953.1 30S ribosomal protein S20 [Dehalobacterium formicoaceticum]
MPNIKSAKKRVQIAESRRMKNASVKSSVKTAIKKFVEVDPSTDKDNAQSLLTQAIRKMDKAAGKGILHKKAVARKKSKLQRAFNKAN